MHCLRFFPIILLAVICSGCATVTRGTTDQIQIMSDPLGAEARSSLGHSCNTPCTIHVSRRDEFIVSFAKEGYKRQSITVGTKLTGEGATAFVGNVLIGGVVGMGVDAATGAALKHFPNPVFAILEPIASKHPRNDPPARQPRSMVAREPHPMVARQPHPDAALPDPWFVR